MRTVLLWAVLVSLAAVPAAALSWQVYPSNGHLYGIVTGDAWTDAEAQAVSLGGHLVTIEDAAENDWILTSVLNPSGEPYTWIGLYQLAGSEEPAGGWVWSSDELVTYTNWNPVSTGGPEPNDAGGGEDWAEMYSSSYGYGRFAGYWNDMKPNSNETPRIGIVELIPEPSSLLALACGVGGLAGLRWRRRK